MLRTRVILGTVLLMSVLSLFAADKSSEIDKPFIIIHVINNTDRKVVLNIEGLTPEEEKQLFVTIAQKNLENLDIVTDSSSEDCKEYMGSNGPIRIFIRTRTLGVGTTTIAG